VYIASNISNPLVAPALCAVELQVGAWLRRGSWYSPATLGDVHLWGVAQDLLFGSVVIGGALAVAGATVTYAIVNRRSLDPALARLIEEAASRYLRAGCNSWEFANGKLRLDPVYCEILKHGILPQRGTLADFGCGQGLMLAFIATARELRRRNVWPAGWPDPPVALRLYGIENRSRMVEKARQALGSDATILQGDLRVMSLPRCDVALLFDVLHLMPRQDQDELLARVNETLDPGGLLILREADAGGGWRFAAVRFGNWLCRAVQGRWGRRFHFRTGGEWRQLLTELGFEVEAEPMCKGTPFANVVLYARPNHGP
jgi:SAM-dependent methyltransferase